jgi:hypothetical protein
MTFDQSQDAFRGHKTCKTAGAYLDNAFHYQADEAIGDGTFFNAVGEVASWLSASDELLRGFEAVKATPVSGVGNTNVSRTSPKRT